MKQGFGLSAVILSMTLLMCAPFALVGCASGTNMFGTVLGSTPEAQIAKGADTHKAASTLATVLLRNDKITVSQAKVFSGLLHAASDALDNANTTLVVCRAKTGSTQTTSPDPCGASVKDLIGLAIDGIAGVKKALENR